MELLKSELARQTSPEEINRRCSGCLAPPFDQVLDYIMGVNVRPACCLHDFEYTTQSIPRSLADHFFYLNLKRLILDANLSYLHETLALKTALGYYVFVRGFGVFVW